MVKRPKLFEDSEFIVFGDCFGEFGGTVYFFDKVTKHIYFTESTCSNSVFKKDGTYFVLSELGHSSNSEIKLIDNPRKLTRTRKNKINKLQKYQALGYSYKSGAFQKVLDFWNIQLFSTFKYQEKQLYLVGLNDLIFLAEIIGTEIQIVHPLFNNDFIIHDPVTNQFGNYILINYSIYGTALEKEVCVIIIDGKKITKVDWNENHSL